MDATGAFADWDRAEPRTIVAACVAAYTHRAQRRMRAGRRGEGADDANQQHEMCMQGMGRDVDRGALAQGILRRCRLFDAPSRGAVRAVLAALLAQHRRVAVAAPCPPPRASCGQLGDYFRAVFRDDTADEGGSCGAGSSGWREAALALLSSLPPPQITHVEGGVVLD